MKTRKWNKSRLRELGELRELLNEVGSVNRGNYWLEKIGRCIKRAERLNSSNLNRPRKSFFTFLCAVAAGQEDPESWQ